jgi:glycosyltransferase involved in cell wall biosynthesis
MVAAAHDVPLIVTNFGEIYSHASQARAHRRFIDHLTRTASLTTLSRHCADSYHALDLSPPVEVLPYGVDTSRFAARGMEPSVRRELGFEAADRIALFVGRLVPDMGLHTVLRAAPAILGSAERARIVVAGTDGALRAHAAAVAAASLGRIRLVVDVPEADLPRYLWAADVLMAPTQGPRACGSLAALEAMAAGRPVVAANVGGIPEIVADHDTGILVPPEDPTALAAAVASLLANPARAAEMGRRGVARVRARFDIRQTNVAIEHLFRRVAARRNSPSSPGAPL